MYESMSMIQYTEHLMSSLFMSPMSEKWGEIMVIV